jgi:hypothetical protein
VMTRSISCAIVAVMVGNAMLLGENTKNG